MGKGRKPISNALKVLKGTDQPCRMREEISYEKITKIPKAPDYMCVAGKKVYKITAQQLADQGILNVVNMPMRWENISRQRKNCRGLKMTGL